MTPELWAKVKALYLEACAAPAGHEAYLGGLNYADYEALTLVRRLFEHESSSGPEIDRPCWSSTRSETFGRALELGQTLLGRFEIVGFLGAGGIGEVYRAYDHQQSVFVALKTLVPALTRDAKAFEILRHELNTARLVTSPYVCRLYDFHTTSGETPPFFTMELLEGETLAHYLRRQGPFATERAWPLVEQMIGALQAAHAQGIVHRDFKTSNIMLTLRETRAVVMDFGLAREFVPGASLEASLLSASFAGTPAYMAPEQLRGHKATVASDLYSLGIVLFEMVTGRRPFDGDSPLEIALRRLHEAAPSPNRYVPRLDRRWERAILSCLESEPDRRPRSAAAVCDLLNARPPLLWHRRGAFAAIAASLPALAGAGIWWFEAQRSDAVSMDLFDIENQTGDPALDFLCRGTTSELVRRFAQLDHISIVPIRSTLAAGSGKGTARLVLTGFLSGAPGVERLEVRIFDNSAHQVLWSKIYGHDRFGNLLHLQEEIAAEASSALVRHVGGNAASEWLALPFRHKGTSPTQNATAFESYIRGSSLQQEYSEESLRAAIRFFEDAVSRDSHFALAWASLAECHLLLLNFGFDYEGALVSRARECAVRAIREAPSLAEAHAIMGAVRQADWDWRAAQAEFDRALVLKPKFAKAIGWRAGLVLQFGRFDEAIGDLQSAFSMDPYDRGVTSTYGLALICAKRFQEAIDLLERQIGNRDMLSARNNLAIAYALQVKHAPPGFSNGLYAKAFAQASTIESIERRAPDARLELSDRLYALLYSLRGENREAAQYVEKIERVVNSRRSSPGANASVYVAQGRYEEAETALERATMLRDRFVLYLRVNPLLDGLHGRPRFEALLKTLQLK